MQETQIIRVPSLGWEDPLKEGMTSHSSTLAWRIPWIEEPGGLQSIGLQKVVQVWATEQQQQNPNPNGLLSCSESSWGYVCDVPQVLGVTSSTIIISWSYVSDERAPLLKPNKGKEAEAKVLHDILFWEGKAVEGVWWEKLERRLLDSGRKEPAEDAGVPVLLPQDGVRGPRESNETYCGEKRQVD